MGAPSLFDETSQEVPAWARECRYCRPDEFGRWDKEDHDRTHVPMTCGICGETEPNRYLFETNHGINHGQSMELCVLLCVSLGLRLNHLSYDAKYGRESDYRDMTALDLGWMVTDEGKQIPPEGWPRYTDLSCEVGTIEKRVGL